MVGATRTLNADAVTVPIELVGRGAWAADGPAHTTQASTSNTSKARLFVLKQRLDMIFIPSTAISDRKVYVLGEVGKAGVYELQDNVRLIEAIQLASSFSPYANRKQVILIRGDKRKPDLYQINMLEMLKTGDLSKNMQLEDGDVVFVPRNWIGNLREFYTWFLPGYNRITQ